MLPQLNISSGNDLMMQIMTEMSQLKYQAAVKYNQNVLQFALIYMAYLP